MVLFWNDARSKYWQEESNQKKKNPMQLIYQIISDSGWQKAVVEGSE